MNKIQKVTVLGAGAMGAYFASRFFDTEGFSTRFVARDRRLERLKAKGLVVNGKQYDIPAVHPDEVEQPADLIIVALKQYHLQEAVHDLKTSVGDSTTIISIMNGLDSEEFIGSVYGMDKLLYAVSVGIDAVREGNRITYTKPGKHYLGEAVNTSLSPGVLRVQRAFEEAGITYETPEDMMRMMWWKFMVNVGMNQASAVMRAPYGFFQTFPEARGLMEALMQEVIALAEVQGIAVTSRDIEEWYSFLDGLSPQGKTSMLQDVEAGRKTEVEMFGGKVVDMGKTHQVPTPVNQTVFQIIRVLEYSASEM
ncbi:MAG: ketopantoate reductase family protein [Desulfohalobiaceae bacterium]|nr:ketopantoate reductase family protein [Desulfohalobiaceae bacterium]